MQHLWATSFFRQRYPLAIGAGLLWTAAFPNIGIAGAAWLAPGLMIAAALGKRRAEVFRIGYVAGLAHYLSMLHWLLLIPYRWYGMPLGPAVAWLALSGFLALYPALWVWLVAPLHWPVTSDQSSVISHQSSVTSHQSPMSSHQSPTTDYQSRHVEGGVLARNWVRRTLWGISGAAAWVALEMVLARFLGGFPWDLLGVSQYSLSPLIQVASVTGVYGVAFLIVWLSLALLSAVLLVIRRPTQRSVWIAEVFLPVIVVAIVFNLGLRRLREETPEARTLRVTLVQPSIPQTLIWDASSDAQRFQDLLQFTEQSLTNQTEVLIWPESAVPKMVRYDTNTFEAITGLARRHHLWMIIGSDDAEPRRNAARREEADYFNSSFLISPQGKLVDRYVKRSLVIFGEYVPLQGWLPFLKYFTPIQGGFTPGTRVAPFNLTTLQAQTAVLICFEDVFPNVAREDVNPETDFLVNITNDGWFGQGAAQWQQGVSGLFRAVENGVPLIRCCNNGLTCWIDGKGRLRQILRDERGTIYGSGVLNAEIPIGAAGESHRLTFYTRHGDWFGWTCVVLACLAVARRVAVLVQSKKNETRAGAGGY